MEQSPSHKIPAQIIRQVFVILLIVLMASMIFKEMLPYLTGVLGAITFYILLRKPMSTLVEKKKWGPGWAAGLLMFLSFIGILVPIGGVIWMLGNKIGKAVSNSEAIIGILKEKLASVEASLHFDISSKIDTASITETLSNNLQSLVGGTFNAFIAISIMYFMLYYMLINRKTFRHTLRDYTPMSSKNLTELGVETQKIVRSNALGIPLVAVAQGIIAFIGFQIFSIEDPFFWGIIVTIGSMIPFVGTFVGIIPVFIITLSSGSSFQAWGILMYGIIVVGTTDNIVRLYVLKKLDDVHPLITLIGVIIGVPIFGFLGLIFGPLLISLFMALVKIYRKEYSKEAEIDAHDVL